jgi:hypothetical protein
MTAELRQQGGCIDRPAARGLIMQIRGNGR